MAISSYELVENGALFGRAAAESFLLEMSVIVIGGSWRCLLRRLWSR